MKFFEYPTCYEHTKKIHNILNPHEPFPDVAKFYDASLRTYFAQLQAEWQKSAHNQLFSEECWYKAGRPYYLFHPALTKTFSTSRLDFPIKYLHFPYNALAVQFAENDPNLKIGDVVLRSVLLHTVNECFDTFKKEIVPSKQMALWMDFGERERHPSLPIDLAIYTYRQLVWRDEETVEESIVKTCHPSYYEGMQIPDELVDRCLRLVTSIAFLATDENPIIVPHILSQDQEKYRRADDKRKQQIAERAHRRRKSIGFRVGDETMFDMGKIGQPIPQEKSETTGRHLQFAHIVSGHWKLVRHGKNLEQGRVRWISPYVQGEGKPFRKGK